MKTLIIIIAIIIAIILFFAWLYYEHRQMKEYDRELDRYQEQTPEYDDTGQRIKKESTEEPKRAYSGKLQRYYQKRKFVKTGRSHNY